MRFLKAIKSIFTNITKNTFFTKYLLFSVRIQQRILKENGSTVNKRVIKQVFL